jgi:hypothetical protein
MDELLLKMYAAKVAQLSILFIRPRAPLNFQLYYISFRVTIWFGLPPDRYEITYPPLTFQIKIRTYTA